ncbi:MAG: ABC transporter substrate-binding protein [Chloroflexi bacterium]|nr:MAG: ABC transporter substrate-binding protein [Chloroflexota bacterium]
MPRRKTRPSSSATGAPLFFSDPCGRSNGITFGAAAPVRRRRGRWREMRRIWSALVPIAVLSLIVAGCGAATTTPGPSASSGATLAPELIKIKSSYGNVTPANLAPFYAKEMGIFAKHGLDVDLVLIDGGAPSAAALISGQIQFGNFGGTETMSGVAAGSDMVAVSLFVPVTPWQLLAKSEYKTPEDLRGKVVGVASKGGSSEVAADLSLQRLKLDPNKDVTKQALGSVANLTAAMIGGAVYAGPGHPPDTVLLLKNGFKVIVDLAAEKIPATDNCTVVRRSYLQSNRQTVQAYIDAEIEAIAAAKKDKPGTIKVMSKLLKIEDQDALGQAYDFYVGQIMPTYPHLDPAAFNYTRDTLAATNPNVKNLDVTKAIDDSFVADAEKRGVGK